MAKKKKKKNIKKKTSKPLKKSSAKKKAKVTKKIALKKRTTSVPFRLEGRDRVLDFFTRGLHGRNLQKYKGVKIEDHYGGNEHKNEFGECFVISSKAKINPLKTNSEIVKQKLLLDLKAVSGISDITESNLKREGIHSIAQLKTHHRYGNEASHYINCIEERNGSKLFEQLSNRFTSTNPLLLLNSSFFNLSEIAFIDIETLGLYDCPLFLIGIATFDNEELVIEQILLRGLVEEKSALHFLNEYLVNKTAICSFNGKSFDVPFIRKRMERHDLVHSIIHPHFDIKYFSSKAFGDTVMDCRLTTLEYELFKTKRVDDIPSSYVPDFYTSYVRTKNIGAIVPIINHNKQDLISTANIFVRLHELWSN